MTAKSMMKRAQINRMADGDRLNILRQTIMLASQQARLLGMTPEHNTVACLDEALMDCKFPEHQHG